MRGEVTVRVRCLMPEKLIDRATAKGARFADVRLTEDSALVVHCDAQSARLLLDLCRRFNLEARVIRLRGFSALRRFVRQRATLVVGIACAVALSALFLTRLWIVDIAFTGALAASGDPAALSRSLAALGVRPGIGRSIDTGLLAQRLLARTDNYSYASARLQGVCLLVLFFLTFFLAKRVSVCSITAAAAYPWIYLLLHPGLSPAFYLCLYIMVLVIVFHRSNIKRLIRGEEQATKEETRPIGALGEVIVRSWFSGEARLPLTQTDTVDTGRRSSGAKLTLMDMEWPIARAVTYPSQRTERAYLPIGGLFVPLEIQRFTNVEILRQESEIPMETLRARARALSLASARAALVREGPRAYSPGDSWVDYEITDGVLVARAVIEIQSDAAVTREALQGG